MVVAQDFGRQPLSQAVVSIHAAEWPGHMVCQAWPTSAFEPVSQESDLQSVHYNTGTFVMKA